VSQKNSQLHIDQSQQDPKDPEFSLLVPEKKKAIDGIRKLKLRVTPPELSSASGLSINQASYWLNKIAGETRGKLEVANDGTIFYTFTPGFTNAYLQRGFRKFALIVGTVLFQFLYWIIRMSFGVALVASILVVIAIFIALALAALAQLGDSNNDSGDFRFDFIDLRFLGDLFLWNYSPSVTYYQNSVPSNRRDRYNDFVEKHPKGNFFLECFSFLFGDGAPNSNLEQIRWQQIARVITEHGGVVSTEQLAPFLDGDRSDSGKIMSALAQFNGRPEVTKSGYIVYVFPDFLVPGAAPKLPAMVSERYLEEERWKFTAFPNKIPLVLTLACLNFAGSWWLFKHIASIALLSHLAILIDVLIGYAAIFLIIPAVRWTVLQVLNRSVDARNERRRKAWELVREPKDDVLEEIQEAKQIRLDEIGKMTDRSIVYDSEKDLLEQQFDQQLNNPQPNQQIDACPDGLQQSGGQPSDGQIIDLKKKQKKPRL
jgi:hypothetical protein